MKIELCHTRGERENPAGILPAYAHLGLVQVSSLEVGKDRVIHSRALTTYDYWRLVGLDVYAAHFHKMGTIEQVVDNPDTGRHHLLVAVVPDRTAAEIQRRDEPKPGLDLLGGGDSELVQTQYGSYLRHPHP